MKVAIFTSLIAYCSAFSQKEASRRDAMAGIAAAGAALVPSIANAAAGESPRFSVFGLIGDGTSYSEGAAYGSDQSKTTYSPYSVYGEASEDSLYKPGTDQYIAKKKAVLKETANRLLKLDAYADRKEWFNVNTELSRYMYETRGAVGYLATSKKQKQLATNFFQDIEKVSIASTQKKQDECKAAIAASISSFNELTSALL